MNGIGAQEFYLPALNRLKSGRNPGRWTVMGDNMFRLKDRKGRRPVSRHDPRGDLYRPCKAKHLRSMAVASGLVPDSDKIRDEPRPQIGPFRVRRFDEGRLYLRRRLRPRQGPLMINMCLLPDLCADSLAMRTPGDRGSASNEVHGLYECWQKLLSFLWLCGKY